MQAGYKYFLTHRSLQGKQILCQFQIYFKALFSLFWPVIFRMALTPSWKPFLPAEHPGLSTL
jgi:hypothetical protein